MPYLVCYNAAAGAGKTHTLVKSYLELALQKPTAFQHILGVTFTHKATQAFKQRIRKYLFSLALGDDKLAKSLGLTSLSSVALQTKAQALYTCLLQHYHNFHIINLDSFLCQFITHFGSYCDLDQDVSITLNIPAVVEEVVAETLKDVPQSSYLADTLAKVAKARFREGKNWNFKPLLTSLTYTLLKSDFLCESELLTQAFAPIALQHYITKLYAIRTNFEKQLTSQAQQAIQAMVAAGFQADDFSYGTKGVIGYLQHLADQKIKPPTQRAQKAALQVAAWYTRKQKPTTAFIQLIEQILQPALQRILALYETERTKYYTAKVLCQHLDVASLMHHLLTKLEIYKKTHHVVLITEVPHYVKNLFNKLSPQKAYTQLGFTCDHLLIDEFQDLAKAQWQALVPLIQNGLAQDKKSMLVGDAKQAIYRWRGGDATLLTDGITSQIGVSKTRNIALTYNWRSHPYIIAFNNSLFPYIASQLTKHFQAILPLDNALHQKCDQLYMPYTKAQQQLPPDKKIKPNAQLQIYFLEDKDWKKNALMHLVQQMEQLQAQGIPPEEIVWLVRNNREAQEISQFLATYQQDPAAKPSCSYQTIAREVMTLGANHYINLLIQALYHFLPNPHPYHTVQFSYFYKVCHGKKPIHTDLNKPVTPAFLAQHSTLAKQPLYTLIESLVAILLADVVAARPYIEAFQQLLLTEAPTQIDLAALLTWWEAYGQYTTVPNTIVQGSMPIMTIHQAKGLEFTAVMLPFAHWKLDHTPQKAPLLWAHTSVAPFNVLPLAPIRYQAELAHTAYASAYYEEKMQTYLDACNLLYVALTRPTQYLYICAPKPKAKTYRTVGDLLYARCSEPTMPHQETASTPTLADYPMQQDIQKEIFTLGQLPQKIQQKSVSIAPIPSATTYYTYAWWKRWRNQALPSLINTQAIAYGNWLHALLGAIDYAVDWSTVYTHFIKSHRVPIIMHNRLYKDLQRLFAQSQVQAWFAKGLTIKKEATLMLPNGQLLRPDRIVSKNEEATIIDFKTGQPQPSHILQVQAYKKALHQMGYHDVKAYLLYTHTVHVVRVEG